jgi:xanthine/CO dehydrogenase XdhC/CoxF family maturation factor
MAAAHFAPVWAGRAAKCPAQICGLAANGQPTPPGRVRSPPASLRIYFVAAQRGPADFVRHLNRFHAGPAACLTGSCDPDCAPHCVTIAAPAGELSGRPKADVLIDGYQPGPLNEARRFVVVATQGKGDEAALRAALCIDGAYHAFVGSRRRMTALGEKLVADGIATARVDRIKAPAGLDLGAITPEEIVLSILAEMTALRRCVNAPGPHKQRWAGKAAPKLSLRGLKLY